MKSTDRYHVKGPFGMNLALRPARMDPPPWLPSPRPPIKRHGTSTDWADEMVRLVDVIESHR